MLSQTLVASTYPLELVQLQQWLDKNPGLAKDQNKLAEAVKKQPWDPSIQTMAALPDLVKRLTTVGLQTDSAARPAAIHWPTGKGRLNAISDNAAASAIVMA